MNVCRSHRASSGTWIWKNTSTFLANILGSNGGLRQVLDGLDRREVRADTMTYRVLLKHLIRNKAFGEGKRLHEHIIRDGYDGDTHIGNLIVQMYGKCKNLEDAFTAFSKIKHPTTFSWNILITVYSHSGQVEDAKRTFDELSERDSMTWNVLLTAYAQNGQGKDGLECFRLMTLEGVEANKYSFIAAIDACASFGDLSQGILVHSHIDEKFLLEPAIASSLVNMYGKCKSLKKAKEVFDNVPNKDVQSKDNAVLLTAMVTAYTRTGNLQEAKSLFKQMKNKDVITWTSMVATYAEHDLWFDARETFDNMPMRDAVAWNAMIAAYARSGYCRKALEIFLLMDLDGMQPNNATYVSVFDACSQLGALLQGEIIHDGIRYSKFEEGLSVSNALLNLYGKCKRPDKAIELFRRMSVQDSISWTSIVSAYANNGDLQEARKLLNEMPDWDSIAWDTMIIAYAQNGYLQEAKSAFDALPEPKMVSWTALITAYAEKGHHAQEALRLLRIGDLQGLQPDHVSFIAIVDACANLTALQEGKIIHASISDRGFQFDVVLGTALVNMYSKCGMLEYARGLFDEMPEKNSITWNSMLTAYAQAGQPNQAVELFPLINLDGLQPTDITFISMITACSHAGGLDVGRSLFMSIQEDYGLKLTEIHYICMIDLLGRAGRLNMAEELINNMPFEPRSEAWLSYLRACKVHSDSNKRIQAAKTVMTLDSETSAPYALLF